MANNSKYIFDGVEYGEGRLVLAVIKRYLNDTNSTYAEMRKDFQNHLQGGVDTLISESTLKQKLQTSDDPKKRFFMDSLLTAGDGEKFYVTNQWGIGNIGQFVEKARDLGFVIVNADFKALFDAYKKHPNDKWIPGYRDTCKRFSEYKGKETSEYDGDFLKEIWLKPQNLVSSVKPGFLSQDEYNKIEDQLPEITKEIADDPTPSMLSKVIKWARHAKEEGRLQSVKYGVIHRVFAAASPGQYSTITKEKNLENLIDALNREFGFVVDKKGNWQVRILH